MTHPCCPTCGEPMTKILQVGPTGITALRCPKGCGVFQKPEWR